MSNISPEFTKVELDFHLESDLERNYVSKDLYIRIRILSFDQVIKN